MMKYGYILLAAGLLAGCSETAVSSVSPETGEKSENSLTVTTVSDTTYFSDRDLIQGYDESEAEKREEEIKERQKAPLRSDCS